MTSTTCADHSIQVEGGLISGVNGESPDVIIFKGVPYAAPPIGDLRWCPPKPVVPWDGVRKCDTFSKICPQLFQPEEGFYRKEFYDDPDPEISEDCLYLNAWVPKKTNNKQSFAITSLHLSTRRCI